MTKKMININEISTMAKGTRGSGLASVKCMYLAITSNNRAYYRGILCAGDEIWYKIWCDSSAFETVSNTKYFPLDALVYIEYVVDDFGGRNSLIINSLSIQSPISPREYTQSGYNMSYFKDLFVNLITDSGLSKKGRRLLRKILDVGGYTPVWGRFLEEQAAMTHHDCTQGGLFAHTTKCLDIYSSISKYYYLPLDETANDLLIIGIVLHDIGKIFEMYHGKYQLYSYNTHRVLGAEYIYSFKESIIEAYSEDFYHQLISIVVGHHDMNAYSSNTIYALIVHKIDSLEACVKEIDDILLNSKNLIIDKTNGAEKLKLNGKYYSILPQNADTLQLPNYETNAGF